MRARIIIGVFVDEVHVLHEGPQELARHHPDLRIVLDHCGKPDIAGGRFQPWASDIEALASRANVACKLSGLPNQAPASAGVAALRPYADHVLARFGPDRTLWASDWPPLLLSGTGYGDWWSMSLQLLSGLDDDARDAVLGGTARRVYTLH